MLEANCVHTCFCVQNLTVKIFETMELISLTQETSAFCHK